MSPSPAIIDLLLSEVILGDLAWVPISNVFVYIANHLGLHISEPLYKQLVGPSTCNPRSASVNGCSYGSPSSRAWPSFESFNIHLQVENH